MPTCDKENPRQQINSQTILFVGQREIKCRPQRATTWVRWVGGGGLRGGTPEPGCMYGCLHTLYSRSRLCRAIVRCLRFIIGRCSTFFFFFLV